MQKFLFQGSQHILKAVYFYLDKLWVSMTDQNKQLSTSKMRAVRKANIFLPFLSKAATGTIIIGKQDIIVSQKTVNIMLGMPGVM